MNYNAKLGIFGNLQRLFEERNKTNTQVFNTGETAKRADAAATELKETESLTLELAADHEARICMMELGVN